MYALTLVAELDGVTELRPRDDQDHPYYYTFQVQCTSCRETHPNWVSVSRFESTEMTGSRGEANFVWRCKNCKREKSATIKGPPAAYTSSTTAKRQTIIEMDCRGLEFVDFKADGEFEASSAESGTKFTGVDLGESEWYDYDEKANQEVSVRECKWLIERA